MDFLERCDEAPSHGSECVAGCTCLGGAGECDGAFVDDGSFIVRSNRLESMTTTVE